MKIYSHICCLGVCVFFFHFPRVLFYFSLSFAPAFSFCPSCYSFFSSHLYTHASDNNSCKHRMDHSYSRSGFRHTSLVAQSAFASLRRCAVVHSLWYNFALMLKLNNKKNNRRHFNVQLLFLSLTLSNSCSFATISSINGNDSAEISIEWSNRKLNRFNKRI